jgi:hypothetical protein
MKGWFYVFSYVFQDISRWEESVIPGNIKVKVISLLSGWNWSIATDPPKRRWKIRISLFLALLFLITVGTIDFFVFDLVLGISEFALAAALLLIWPLIEWMVRQKAINGTSIDIVGISMEELLGLMEWYLRSREYRYRYNQERLIIMKGEGFQLLDSSIRLTVFEVKPPHLSGKSHFSKGKKALRLGIRNVDRRNMQEAIAIHIDLDWFFKERGIRGSPPRRIPVVYKWDGNSYTTVA